MYIVLIGYLYVILMMALFEAFSPAGSVLGGLMTFAVWGVFPTVLLAYLLGTPARLRRKRQQEEAEQTSAQVAVDEVSTHNK